LMIREISAGGVVVRDMSGTWHVALIEPQKEESAKKKLPVKLSRAVLTLPKGLLDSGEKPEAAALREVFEETGVTAEAIAKIVDIKYTYTRSWGDGERVFKIVSFYLMRYVSGNIGEIAPEMRVEVKRALWVPLAEARSLMAYSGEKRVMQQAQALVEAGAMTEKKAGVPGRAKTK